MTADEYSEIRDDINKVAVFTSNWIRWGWIGIAVVSASIAAVRGTIERSQEAEKPPVIEKQVNTATEPQAPAFRPSNGMRLNHIPK